MFYFFGLLPLSLFRVRISQFCFYISFILGQTLVFLLIKKMTLGNHETLVDTIIILSRREPPHVPARPILYTEASSRVRAFFSRWDPLSFSISFLSANPRAQSRDDLPSFLFFLNRVRAVRRTSRICGEQRERRGGRQINSEQRRGIPACINAFHGCYEHCYRRHSFLLSFFTLSV